MQLSLKEVGAARAVLLAGPTASGKSAVALRLAEEVDAAGRKPLIVNADSMQVYDALRVLTARPTEGEEKALPHRLYGHVPAERRYSVGAWISDVEWVLREARESDALPIFVGGTGLYFKALTEGLAQTPDIPAEVRAYWAERLKAEGLQILHAELVRRDRSAGAAIRPSDKQRIVRALEVLEATGRPLAEWQERAQAPAIIGESEPRFVLAPDRAELYGRIEARFDEMVKEGALEEVKALLARGLEPSLPVMKAHGVREFSAFIRKEIQWDAAVAHAKQDTRNYAKRQTTWFKHQMADWTRIRL